MRCRAARKRLSAYTDGSLALWEIVRLKEHLSGCAACRGELSAVRRLNRLLAGRATAEPAVDWPAFEAALARRLERQQVDLWALPWYRQAGVLRAAATAVFVAVLVGTGVWLHTWLRPPRVKPEPVFSTTLRYEGQGRFRMVAQVVPPAKPAVAPAVCGAPAPGGDAITPAGGCATFPDALARLAGAGQAWSEEESTFLTVQYDDARGRPTEFRYVFPPAPR